MKLKLFIAAELDLNIDHKDIRESRNPFEAKINEIIKTKEYDLELKNFGYIMILITPTEGQDNYPEVIKYSKRTKRSDFRFKFDIKLFKKSDVLNRQRMLYQNLVRAIDILEEKGLNKTALDELRQDIYQVALENDWVKPVDMS